MPAVRQPDLAAALRLVRDLEGATGAAAVRGAVLTELPRSIRCDALTWTAAEPRAGGAPRTDGAGALRPSAPVLRRTTADGHRLSLDLAHGDGRRTALVVARAEGRFTDAELALLTLLQAHLVAALRRADATAGLAALHLTPREQAVLDLVARGAANATIARELAMRPRTVEKHLEHAYAKLGVRSRTAAVAVLREITH